MSKENAAITAKTELKRVIKAGKTECATLANIINQIIDQALWEYLDLPGDSAADKLHNLICLPFDQGGLNSQIHEIDALLTISASTQRKFRTIVYAAKQGYRSDLKTKEEDKVDVEFSGVQNSQPKAKSKAKKPSSSQLTSDRAASRAAEAVPEINDLLEQGLVAKNVAAKMGQKLENPDEPTLKDREIISNRKQISKQLKKIVPDPLPEDPQELNRIRKQVKQVIEQTTGLKSSVRISFNRDPQVTAKGIVKAIEDIDYLQQLIVSLELEIEELQSQDKSKSKPQSNLKQDEIPVLMVV
ncbi:hypothetical protein C7B62_18680 [Pleurocapsa sp. CCALA 161]|uniref:hypothetical protein n=1 Tax=Pleurocapsa sp. CCALA 161 TaxID=2107688 RepID=UPI000D07F1A0|nr:hypothetical protein [Pleurocapsa sp. CCALA 161]PSB07863.1 hypothetical protein C7B62_18680 [Pleurocapsa sp. CCALA 161]